MFVMGINLGGSVHGGKCGEVPQGNVNRPSIPSPLMPTSFETLRTASLEGSYNLKEQFYGENNVIREN